jgi:cell division protein FtsB
MNYIEYPLFYGKRTYLQVRRLAVSSAKQNALLNNVVKDGRQEKSYIYHYKNESSLYTTENATSETENSLYTTENATSETEYLM